MSEFSSYNKTLAPKTILSFLICEISITSALAILYSNSFILPSIKDCSSLAAWYSAFSERSPCALASAIVLITFGLSLFLSFLCWNFFAFWTAILQLSTLLGRPAPIPIVEKLFVIIIAFDLTNLHIFKANSADLISFLVGLSFVTNFKSLFLKVILFLCCIKMQLTSYL